MTAGIGAYTGEELTKLREQISMSSWPVDQNPHHLVDRLLATIAARDAEIERAWGALEPVERGRSTLATVVSARIAQRDAEIERLRGQLHELRHRFEYSVMNDALVEARARVAQLESATRPVLTYASAFQGCVMQGEDTYEKVCGTCCGCALVDALEGLDTVLAGGVR